MENLNQSLDEYFMSNLQLFDANNISLGGNINHIHDNLTFISDSNRLIEDSKVSVSLDISKHTI